MTIRHPDQDQSHIEVISHESQAIHLPELMMNKWTGCLQGDTLILFPHMCIKVRRKHCDDKRIDWPSISYTDWDGSPVKKDKIRHSEYTGVMLNSAEWCKTNFSIQSVSVYPYLTVFSLLSFLLLDSQSVLLLSTFIKYWTLSTWTCFMNAATPTHAFCDKPCDAGTLPCYFTQSGCQWQYYLPGSLRQSLSIHILTTSLLAITGALCNVIRFSLGWNYIIWWINGNYLIRVSQVNSINHKWIKSLFGCGIRHTTVVKRIDVAIWSFWGAKKHEAFDSD